MTYNEAIEWMDSRHWSGTGKGIVRSQELLERLGNPQDKLKFVHVAGTNGKGSVCACLSKILTAAGYQVGLFVSPHLKRFNDRIYFNGTEIGDEDFARLASCIRAQAEVMEDAPTVFEIMTAMGMLYFAEKQCDLVMLEVGMGGRLDSTNVIRTPEACRYHLHRTGSYKGAGGYTGKNCKRKGRHHKNRRHSHCGRKQYSSDAGI